MSELDANRAAIVSRLADLNARIAVLADEAEGLKAELRDLGPGEYAIAGRPAVSIVPTRRFDAAAALQAIPTERRSECLKVEPDAGAIRKMLTPEQVDGFMVVAGKPKVVLQ
jgi:hypothetical protein